MAGLEVFRIPSDRPVALGIVAAVVGSSAEDSIGARTMDSVVTIRFEVGSALYNEET